MAITNFIPQIWSARLTANFFANSVFAANANRNYEGDATMGNTVRVFTLDPNSVTTKEYTRNADIDGPEGLSTATQDVLIDQERYFNFAVDDLDAVQIRAPLIDAATGNAANRLAQDVDGFAAGLLTANANGAWGLREEASEVGFDLNWTSQLKEFALEQNIPWGNYVAVMSPAAYRRLDEDILEGNYGAAFQSGRVTEGQADADATLNAGFAGVYNGVRLYVSNQAGLVTGTGNAQRHLVWAFSPEDFAMIVQTNRIEAYRPEGRFADAVKGLINYGGKVLNAGRMAEFVFDLEPDA